MLKRIVWLLVLVLVAALAYGGWGYRDARVDTPALAARADALIADGRGGAALGPERRALLLAVEDPSFLRHVGFDLTTPGAGATTITQSLAKREGFADFSPGLKKLRQTGYALGLEAGLSKPQILALFLDSVPMGRLGDGPDAAWVDGLHAASLALYQADPDTLPLRDFARLVAVMIAPGELRLSDPGPRLEARVDRILALTSGRCTPRDHDDVWLEGCAEAN